MSNFPLYNSLIKNLPKKDLTVKQKDEFVNQIQNMDETGKELIYALIQFYYIANEKKNIELPYKGQKEEIGKGCENLTWVLTDFPIKLRQLLYKFINLHIKKMEEEQEREFSKV